MASKPWFDAERGRWYMKYKPDPKGHWKRVSLGKQPPGWSASRPPKTPPQVIKDRAREFEEMEYRARNNLGAAPKRAESLATYVADYLDAYAGTHDKGSIRLAKRFAGEFLAFAEKQGIKTLQGVNKGVCRDYLQIRVGVVSPSSLQTEKGYLSPIWSKAVDDELIAVNPWKLVKVPGTIVQPEATFWSPEEVAAIASHCAKPWQSDLVILLATTGIRISATLAMEWDWIDFGGGFITVPKEHSKSGQPYKLAMIQTAREVLERRAIQGKALKLIFPSTSGRGCGRIRYDTAYNAIMRAIEKAKVPPGTPHDLRHTYGRWLAIQGTPFPVIQAQLGHASPTMTARYTKINETEARRHVGDMRMEAGPDKPAESA